MESFDYRNTIAKLTEEKAALSGNCITDLYALCTVHVYDQISRCVYNTVSYFHVLCNAKKSFYPSANVIFENIGQRTASEDVFIRLTKSKCVPCLMYGFDACY